MALTPRLEKFGITPDTHVVVYDTIGVFSSPRGAYTFKSKSREGRGGRGEERAVC